MKTVLKSSRQAICNIVGHKWLYQDYTNWMKENGEPYDFTASRTCSRCRERGYYYNEWVSAEEKMTRYDVKSRSEYSKKPPFLQHFQ